MSGKKKSRRREPVRTVEEIPEPLPPPPPPGKAKGFLNFFKDLRGESIMLFFALSNFLVIVFTQHFVWMQVCKRRFPNSEMCSTSSKIDATNENEIQRKASEILFGHFLIKTIPSVLLLLLWGPWSDLHGRLLPTLAPMIGSLISTILYILIDQFQSWPLYTIYLAALPAGLTGNYSSFMMGYFGWINDAHDKQTLTTKVATVNGVEVLMMVLAPVLGHALLKAGGFVALFSTSASLMLVACILVCIFIKDHQYPPASLKILLLDMINWRNIVSIFQVMTVQREDDLRLYLNLILASIFPIAFSFFGHQEILYLYLRLVANFNVHMYTIYSSIQGLCEAIGFLILAPILIHVAKMDDIFLGIISNIAFSIFYIATGLAKNTIALFLICAIQIPGVISLMTTRTFVSKIVHANEIGKGMSLVGEFQAVGRLIGQAVGAKLYQHTLHYFPGAFYLLAGIILYFSVAVNIYIFVQERKKERNKI